MSLHGFIAILVVITKFNFVTHFKHNTLIIIKWDIMLVDFAKSIDRVAARNLNRITQEV